MSHPYQVRFSQFVSKRVRETVWHVSQQLTETADGLIWEADIGDITEIRPWLCGWGADGEVLELRELREEMIAEARRLARVYGVRQVGTYTTSSGSTLLDDLWGNEGMT